MAGGFAVITAVFAIPFYAIWTYHKRKMMEIKMRQDVQIAEETRKAIAALRNEFKELRDTTSAYDVSLDNTLQRLERRIEHIEQRSGYAESVEQPIQYQAGRQ
jgi:hypothetical protein